MEFAELLQRLLEQLNGKVSNGELTERGLARRVGLSQAHVHNVLKGARVLTADTADRMLRGLGIGLLDLFEREELLSLVEGKRGCRWPLEEGPVGEHAGRAGAGLRKPAASASLRDRCRARRKRSAPN
jgi:transcriptional regulator with XRE-family HTH domain